MQETHTSELKIGDKFRWFTNEEGAYRIVIAIGPEYIAWTLEGFTHVAPHDECFVPAQPRTKVNEFSPGEKCVYYGSTMTVAFVGTRFAILINEDDDEYIAASSTPAKEVSREN
jgi:hypothetical protein